MRLEFLIIDPRNDFSDTLIAMAEQALSHRVANTVRDLADQWPPERIGQLTLLEDARSPVPGFGPMAADFLAALGQRGMDTVTAAAFRC